MLDRMVSASFQNIEKTNQVRLQVCIGIIDAVPYSRLGGKIDDIVDGVLLKDVIQCFLVGKVSLIEVEVVTGEQSQPFFLKTHLVIIVQIVQPDDATTLA